MRTKYDRVCLTCGKRFNVEARANWLKRRGATVRVLWRYCSATCAAAANTTVKGQRR
jgi:hypothetical protein